jgi:hypothetical protein
MTTRTVNRRAGVVRAAAVLLALEGLGVSIATSAGAAVLLPPPAPNAKQSWISAFGGKISDTELMKAMRDRLGGLFQNLQVVVSVCSCQGFATEADRLLQSAGDYSVATSRRFGLCEGFDFTDQATKGGKTGLKLADDYYMHGWYAEYFRGIEGDANKTAQQLQEFAVANDYEGTMNGSMIVGTDGGKAAKIHDGTNGSRAAMWHTFGKQLQVKKVDAILKARGYDNDSIDWAYADKGGQTVEGVPIDRDGDRDTMFGAGGVIENMRTFLDDDAGSRKALFVISAHGSWGSRKAEKKEDATPQQPRQGRQYTPGSSMSMEIDTTDDDLFRRSFFEGFLTDDPELEPAPGDRPMFLITTSEESFAGPVDVFVDGVDIGSFVMRGLSQGSSYTFNLSDAAWQGLYDAHALDDALLDFRFAFGDGSFRVATEWDQDLFDLDNYGVQLVGVGVIKVPGAGTAGLLALAGVAAARRRRA